MKSWFSRWRHNPLISAGVCEEIIVSWHLCNAPEKVTGGRAEVLKWEGKKTSRLELQTHHFMHSVE